MSTKSKIYFASDFHLGMDTPDQTSREREQYLVDWLDEIKLDAKALYLLGDIFDYWFEYKEVVPRGHFRFLSKLGELSALGIDLILFTGNHDVWYFDYLEEEIGIEIYREPARLSIEGKTFYLAHGDGVGKGDGAFKIIKSVFTNPFCQWLFARLHPNTGIGLMRWLSQKSRERHGEDPFLMDKERTVRFAATALEAESFDFFICGHRHWPVDLLMNDDKARYINLGDWMKHRSYVEFDQGELKIKFFKNDKGEIIQ